MDLKHSLKSELDEELDRKNSIALLSKDQKIKLSYLTRNTDRFVHAKGQDKIHMANSFYSVTFQIGRN